MPASITPSFIIDGTLYTLVIFSVITWVIIFYKIWEFAHNSRHNQAYAEHFWQAHDLEAAKEQSLRAEGPLARIAVSGFTWQSEAAEPGAKPIRFYSSSPQELLEQALRLQVQKEQQRIESGLTYLASIASTAPFVGLFGTVVGIMNAMQQISKAGSASLDTVAGPIGEALIATAVGIAVAVPAVLAYNLLLRRVKLQRLAMENFADGFMHIAFHTSQPKV